MNGRMIKQWVVAVVVVAVLLLSMGGTAGAAPMDTRGPVGGAEVMEGSLVCDSISLPPGWGPNEDSNDTVCLFEKVPLAPVGPGDCEWLEPQVPPGWGPEDDSLMPFLGLYCRIADMEP